MNNPYSLLEIFSHPATCFAISAGLLVVFLAGMSKSLFYLAGTQSAFLFESLSVCRYLEKSKHPEKLKLKILFLPFPTREKQALGQYLESQAKIPSAIFSTTLEELKQKALQQSQWCGSVAIFCFLAIALMICLASIGNWESKLSAILATALALFCTCKMCDGIYALLKYSAFLAFKKMTCKLDLLHITHNGCNSGNKNSDGSFSESVPLQDWEVTPQSSQARERQLEVMVEKMRECKREKEQEHCKDSSKKPALLSLLDKLKNAIATLDFDCFETLSADLGKTLQSEDLSVADHKTLQDMLTKYLEEWTLAKENRENKENKA